MRIVRSCLVVVLVGALACGGTPPPPPSNVTTAPAGPPESKQIAAGVRVTFVPNTTSISLDGTVRDSRQEEPLAGATLVVTSPLIAGELTAITDERGHFAFGDLADGTYAVTIYYADQTRELSVDVQHALTTRVAVDWKDGDVTLPPATDAATYTSAIDALTHGAIEPATDLARRELALAPTARAHAMLALALYGTAIDAFHRELRNATRAPDIAQLRAGLGALTTAIDDVQAELAEAAKDPQFSLELCVGCITADGALGLPPGFLDVERDRANQPLPEGDLRRRPTIRFDAGDVAWARAMLSFQQALADIALAYDWSWAAPILYDGRMPKAGERITIALVEPARITRARDLVLAGLKLSDDARAAYLAETDDDREWVPNPRQSSYASPLTVDATLYATWAQVVGDVRALVDGKAGLSLPAVWALLDLGKGAPRGFIDVGAMFTAPTSIVLEVGALDRLEGEKDVKAVSKLTTQLVKDLIGNGYRTKMRASKLTDRLLAMRKELLKAGGQAYEDKLKYVLWIN